MNRLWFNELIMIWWIEYDLVNWWWVFWIPPTSYCYAVIFPSDNICLIPPHTSPTTYIPPDTDWWNNNSQSVSKWKRTTTEHSLHISPECFGFINKFHTGIKVFSQTPYHSIFLCSVCQHSIKWIYLGLWKPAIDQPTVIILSFLSCLFSFSVCQHSIKCICLPGLPSIRPLSL